MRRNCIRALVIAFVALALALWGRALRRDLDVMGALVDTGKEMDWEIGGVTAVRNVGKDQWRISAEKVVRDHPVEYLNKISSQIVGPSGLRTINAPTGAYDHENGTLTLRDADGIWQRSEHPFEWETPEARWEQKNDVWNFPRGVTVSGDIYTLVCKNAVMDGQRKICVKDGCIRWWSE